jgi:Family of unknown function (DUF5335)
MQTMVTREIPKDEWMEFFDGFSRRHDGWLVTVEVLDKRLGAQIEVEERPLKGIAAGRGERGTSGIEIMTGSGPADSLTRIIEHPTRVQIEETPEGAEAAISIESQDEGTTLVRFRSTVLPELVDGVASEG